MKESEREGGVGRIGQSIDGERLVEIGDKRG